MLLQVLEEGRLTDSFGRIVDFRNTIIIMTTNAGASAIKNESAFGFQNNEEGSSYTEMKNRVKEEIERSFRPEFINRFNDVIVFNYLSEKDLVDVVDLELSKLRKRLFEKKLCLCISDEAKKYLIKRGSNVDYGARPLRRSIETHLEDPLSENLLSDMFAGCDVVDVQVEWISPANSDREIDWNNEDDLEALRLGFTPLKIEEMTEEQLANPQVADFQAKLKDLEQKRKEAEDEENQSKDSNNQTNKEDSSSTSEESDNVNEE